MALPPGSVTPETLITLKVSYNDALKKIKLPLKDLTASVLPDKLRNALNVPASKSVTFERYSDSAGGFIVLDKSNVPVYKALVRAAKAKGKLRLKATVVEENVLAAEHIPAKTVCPAAPVMAQATPAPVPHGLTFAKPRMSGTGIFEYRASHASQQTLLNEEAPVPEPFAGETMPRSDPAPVSPIHNLAFRTRDTTRVPAPPQTAWSVYCNNCDVAMDDVHYHCSICEGGDYDLCEECVASGKLCLGEGHWLIKRFIREGKVVTSVTERVCRKAQKESPEVKTMPGGFTEDTKSVIAEAQLHEPTRTCNSCVVVLPEHEFVTCNECEDFDLCIQCHTNNFHGHSAAHSFRPTTGKTVLPMLAQALLKVGRNVAHNAFCDGCDKKIYGVRHKCLSCPDWDYCSECHEHAAKTHPRHRFAPIYEQLAGPVQDMARHVGIYCDGARCSGRAHQSYIVGDRYKCAVCHDTDFCASCEASPNNNHNRSHPLIKLRTPVREVSIHTTKEDNRGNVRNMGDRRAQPTVAPPVEPIPMNTATAVQTVAEIPPTDEKPSVHLAQPKDGDVSISSTPPKLSPVSPALLTAAFVRDSVPDGTVLAPGATFTQVWTLRNEGPFAWPAGCSVRYVGGDNMLNVDSFHPASVSDIAKATESSVVARTVQVGEEISFRIILRAPIRQGKSISYWRLKAADGTPFGHRLWCDIEVRDAAPATSRPEKALTDSTQPVFSPTWAAQVGKDTADRMYQSRVQAMRETQLRLLEHQRMLQATHVPRGGYRAVSAPHFSIPAAKIGDFVTVQPTPPTKFTESETEKARLEAARARVEAIKAKIMRYRAENHKAHALMKDEALTQNTAAQVQIKPETENVKHEQVCEETATEPEARSHVAVPAKEEEAELGASSTSSSQMIFPKLEKESPASSIISAKPAYVQSEDGHIEDSAAFAAEAEHEDDALTSPVAEDFDDLEVVSAGIVSDDEDDGFLTDEEYDILDASDRETVASP